MPKTFAYKAVAASLLISLSSTASAALSDQWYIGAGGGASLLQPEASDSSIDVEDKDGQVGTIYFGKDFDSRSSGQFQLYSFGESTFDDGQSSASYIGGDASLLYRFYDSRDRRQRGAVFGASFYGRFGFGFLDRDSDLPLDDDTPVYFGAGAGFETYFTNNLGLRLEALYHETDIASATLTLVTRFGGHRSRPAVSPPTALPPELPEPTEPTAVTSPVTTPSAVPVPETSVEPPRVVPTPQDDVDPNSDLALQDSDDSFPDVEIMGTTQENTSLEDSAADTNAEAGLQTPTLPAAPTTATTPEALPPAPPLPSPDRDGDGVNDVRDRCPDSNSGYPVNTRGCPLFAGLMPDLTFRDGSAEFDDSSLVVLDRLVQTLEDYPDTFIEIVAHTDNSGSESEQSALTRQRLRSIGLYLVSRGISQDRLLLRSFGGKRPAFDNTTAEGRRRNNRIEVFENP